MCTEKRPTIVEVVAGKICIVNNKDEPKQLKKNDVKSFLLYSHQTALHDTLHKSLPSPETSLHRLPLDIFKVNPDHMPTPNA